MACQKIYYASIDEAKASIKRMKRSRKTSNKLNRDAYPYKCDRCKGIHLTSTPASHRRLFKKNHKEYTRRYRVLMVISENKSIEQVLKYQEHWMTLVLKETSWILKMAIAGKIYRINGKN